jgi:hypothetical protein
MPSPEPLQNPAEEGLLTVSIVQEPATLLRNAEECTI